MKFIISLQGGMAVGKTTLARNLEKKYKNLHVFYENPYPIVQKRKELNLDIRKKEGFVHNQRLFIQAEIERFKTLPEGIVLLDRGPEDIEFYTLHFPKSIGENWDIETELNQELQELRNCRSNLILYLDAPVEILRERKKTDKTRSRNSFEEQLKFYNQEKNWYKHFNTTMILDVGFKTELEVEESIAEILHKKNFQ
ncbi:AAA family ATPase [Bacillus pseudomycoides]|uniref:AAA family ATPase n=1 Tax=Bacillus pseudomycoides TaxID=64104 RepID=UPI000BFD77C0|nr:AAA family ATPase [Bacillus pseudomycoides]PHE55803.1 ATP-binding protein [Bacillus pseudomycoides]